MNTQQVKVLMVEDNPSDVRVIQRLLSQSSEPSFEIEVSDRVGTGLEHLSSGAVPDVILLDIDIQRVFPRFAIFGHCINLSVGEWPGADPLAWSTYGEPKPIVKGQTDLFLFNQEWG